MKLSNSLVKLPQLTGTMTAMSAEMMKAGIMAEMVDETFEGLDAEDEELEDEAEGEVEKVLWEITDGKLGTAGKVGNSTLPSQAVAEDPEEEAETQRIQAELNSLLSA